MRPAGPFRLEILTEVGHHFGQRYGFWLIVGAINLAACWGLAVLLSLIFSTFPDLPPLVGHLWYGLLGVAEGFLLIGACQLALQQVRGEPQVLRAVFRPRCGLGNAIAGSALMPVLVQCGYWFLDSSLVGVGFLTAVGGATLAFFMPPLLADQAIGPIAALKQSVEKVRRSFFPALGFTFLLGVLFSLGSFLVFGIVPLALALTYRDAFGSYRDQPWSR